MLSHPFSFRTEYSFASICHQNLGPLKKLVQDYSSVDTPRFDLKYPNNMDIISSVLIHNQPIMNDEWLLRVSHDSLLSTTQPTLNTQSQKIDIDNLLIHLTVKERENSGKMLCLIQLLELYKI